MIVGEQNNNIFSIFHHFPHVSLNFPRIFFPFWSSGKALAMPLMPHIWYVCLSYIFQKLLEVAHDLFEEQTCLDNVVQKIMQRAQSLLKCERCSVMLVKDPTAEVRTLRETKKLHV